MATPIRSATHPHLLSPGAHRPGFETSISIDAALPFAVADIPPLPNDEGKTLGPLLGAIALVLVVYLVSRVLRKK